MKLQEIITALKGLKEKGLPVNFLLEGGGVVPPNYHITELVHVFKYIINCGGELENKRSITMQLWHTDDVEHKIAPEKFLSIIDVYTTQISNSNEEVFVEYQNETIGIYALSFDGVNFTLMNTKTDCTAKEKCGIIEDSKNNCSSGGCC